MNHENVKIEVDTSSHIEKSLRKFKRMCEAFGVVKEYRKRKEHKKPSICRKEKLEAAEKRRHKNEKTSYSKI